MNTNTYLEILCESTVNANPNVNPMIEGKKWDAVKKVWRDHKGKIITGTALLAAGAATVGAAGYKKNKQDVANRNSAYAQTQKNDAENKARQDKQDKDHQEYVKNRKELKRKSGVTASSNSIFHDEEIARGKEVKNKIFDDNETRRMAHFKDPMKKKVAESLNKIYQG